ncbi:MAG: helix-turn-helix transcriptional regulator, partial [Phycisphaerales bacterium]
MHQRAKRIAEMASGPNPPTRAELAEEFNVSRRQVNNLIAHVEGMLGCDVVTRPRDSDGKMAYVVQASDLLKLDMSVSEAIASVHITQSVLGTPLSGDDDAAGKAVGRLEAALAESVRGKLKRLEGRFAIRVLQAAKPPRPEVFRTVLDGMLENRVLHMGFESPYKAGARAQAAASGKARLAKNSPYGSMATDSTLRAFPDAAACARAPALYGDSYPMCSTRFSRMPSSTVRTTSGRGGVAAGRMRIAKRPSRRFSLPRTVSASAASSRPTALPAASSSPESGVPSTDCVMCTLAIASLT